MLETFKGGLHIPDNKDLTAKKPIIALDGDKVHIYPLVQHIGAPLEAKVEVGDDVTVGQILGDSDAFVSTPVHSSVSGVVTEIKPYIHPSGNKVMSVFVQNDFKYTPNEDIKPYDYHNMTPKQMLEVVRRSGIVGMGGAGFPTHVKLSPPDDKKIEYLIVNAAECEPYITSDHRRMIEDPESVIEGIRIVLKILGLSKAHIGIEKNKPDAIKLLMELTRDADDIKVCPLKTKYPQGAEKQLIYAITKRKIPSGALPMDVHAIVINVDTVFQIAKTFKTGMPLTKRVITVSGDSVKNPSNFEVYTGVTFKYLIDAAEGFTNDVKKVVMGGPMMGIAQYTLDVPVIKTTSSVLCFAGDGDGYDESSACIRCGKCVECCPMGLMPLYLSKFSSDNDLERAEEYNILDCIECGLCSYTCPGLKSPLHNIRIAKQKIIAKRRSK